MTSKSLTNDQIADLAARLDAREAQLQTEVRAIKEEAAQMQAREPHAEVGDLGDQAEERTREAVRFTEKERDVEELRRIADARGRMQQGSFGDCVDCGTVIPLARLQALPFSERCVPCQVKFESVHSLGVRIHAQS